MEKHVESHQNNLLTPNATPFIDCWKSALLAQVKMLGITLEPMKVLDFKAISDIINLHLLQQNSINQVTSYQDSPLDDEDQLIIEKAHAYHIPIIKMVMQGGLDPISLSHEIEDYEWLLTQADDRMIDWDTSIYDPVGLEQAIVEHDEAQAEDYRQYVVQVRQLYYATR